MRVILVLAMICAGAGHAAAAERHDAILMGTNVAGFQTVQVRDGSAGGAEYSYNDRDHGDHVVATWTLDAAGVPTAYEGRGVDYFKAPVDDRLAVRDGKAIWKAKGKTAEMALSGPAFFMPADPPPEYYGVLARALLKAPDHRMALLPGGTASIERVGGLTVDGAEWIQYRISGLDLMPLPVWLDSQGGTVAVASLFLSTVGRGREGLVPDLLARQDAFNQAWSARLAQQLSRRPKGDLVIRDARLFDPRDLTVTSGMSVLVRGDRIVRVGPDAMVQTGPDAEVIDARGRFLMPGMWDNHQHFDGVDGMLDIANGVTSARDMANDTDIFLKRVARFDAGGEIGPRVLKAGFIDGVGPNAGPFKRAGTAEEAIKVVDWYADHGYAQIKIYMSMKPELVPVIADRAHARGLRVSGHVPATMSAEQFVLAGADEIQHLNYVELNFLYPEVQDTTRTSERFIKVGERAVEFTPDRPKVRAFIDFLRRHHTVLDPTMTILETWMSTDPAGIAPGFEKIAPRLPLQARRAMTSGAYEIPKGHEEAYRQAIPAMLKLLKALHDAGVVILPGTDEFAGYSLPHELELYARAGIAPAEVLRMATLTPAQVMGVDRDLGVIAPGKLADMVLVDGDPTRDISDVRKVATVIKGGVVYDPRALETALGVAPPSDR